ncbi:MAG: (d)CMP kinase [Leptospira sp.]|nr:(d)CMP kinase [Leptospira sp.]
MNENIIAIDGPAGSGKSTIAREIANEIHFRYLDTGAYYRAVTLFLLEIQKTSGNPVFSEWIKIQDVLSLLGKIKIKCEFSESDENLIFLNGRNISREIRTPEVTEEIKYIASIREIRNFVNTELRNIGFSHRLIMDGRDIGTEVFPDARFKFFVTASIDARAKRRYEELIQKGFSVQLEQIRKDMENRDKSDIERLVAPLKKAPDAILIDTSGVSKDVVKQMILSELRK